MWLLSVTFLFREVCFKFWCADAVSESGSKLFDRSTKNLPFYGNSRNTEYLYIVNLTSGNHAVDSYTYPAPWCKACRSCSHDVQMNGQFVLSWLRSVPCMQIGIPSRQEIYQSTRSGSRTTFSRLKLRDWRISDNHRQHLNIRNIVVLHAHDIEGYKERKWCRYL